MPTDHHCRGRLRLNEPWTGAVVEEGDRWPDLQSWRGRSPQPGKSSTVFGAGDGSKWDCRDKSGAVLKKAKEGKGQVDGAMRKEKKGTAEEKKAKRREDKKDCAVCQCAEPDRLVAIPSSIITSQHIASQHNHPSCSSAFRTEPSCSLRGESDCALLA